jgi:hypothetical protein
MDMQINEIVQWIGKGDVALQYQVYRDLKNNERKELRMRIESEGWGKILLERRKPDGHWARGFYQPKWTSTHYTLMDIRNLCLNPGNAAIQESIEMVLYSEKGQDGGVNPGKTISKSDVCINGMVLNYASYFHTREELLRSIVDFILEQRMPDGGFNCRLNRSGARHSSLHSTICVAEGIEEYRRNGYTYRMDELAKAARSSQEFILLHQLFRSDRTGEIIDPKMLMLSWPSRWRYDILRAMDYFRYAGMEYDQRIEGALEILISKRRKDGTWPLQQKHPGEVHLEMEKTGRASRINTLRALKVLKYYTNQLVK